MRYHILIQDFRLNNKKVVYVCQLLSVKSNLDRNIFTSNIDT